MSEQSQSPACGHGFLVTGGKHPNGEDCIQVRIITLNKANLDIMQRMKAGAGIDIDPTGERLEHLIEFMTRIGVLTSDQREAFELSWVEHLNDALVKAEADLIARLKAKAEEDRRAGAAAQLGVRPTPGGLIVPGHAGRQNGTGRRRRG